MNNLQWLYQTDETFRESVQQAAADWLGSTSANFADAWLRETHRSDYEDLTGQHLDGPCVVSDKFCSDAAKRQISQFVAQETGEADESDAAKSEIRDFADNRENQVDRITDMVNAKCDELHDSREKLEAEIENFVFIMNFEGYQLDMIHGWLDRQAAITERYVLSHPDERDEQIAELRNIAEKYREDSIAAQEERDAYRELCGKMRLLANEISLMEVD